MCVAAWSSFKRNLYIERSLFKAANIRLHVHADKYIYMYSLRSREWRGGKTLAYRRAVGKAARKMGEVGRGWSVFKEKRGNAARAVWRYISRSPVRLRSPSLPNYYGCIRVHEARTWGIKTLLEKKSRSPGTRDWKITSVRSGFLFFAQFLSQFFYYCESIERPPMPQRISCFFAV